MTPQLAAGLTAFVGICLLAGWVTGFRNRSYVGWLGLAFIGLSGFLLAAGRAHAAQEMARPEPAMATLARALLFIWIAALLLSAVSAVRETARRLREIRESHEEAAQGMLELVRASRERAEEAQPEAGRAAGSDDDTA
jgi:ABC-type Fe3+ transport system permease subunit